MAEEQDASVQYNSLFCFKGDNPLRRKCKAVIEWPPFEYIILLVIVVNCIILGFGLYLPADDKTAQTLEKTEIYFLIIFIVEMTLKVIAYGFALHPGSYLRNPWNLIDFFVIVIGILSFFPMGIELDILRMLRVFRLLRLLRLVKIIRTSNRPNKDPVDSAFIQVHLHSCLIHCQSVVSSLLAFESILSFFQAKIKKRARAQRNIHLIYYLILLHKYYSLYLSYISFNPKLTLIKYYSNYTLCIICCIVILYKRFLTLTHVIIECNIIFNCKRYILINMICNIFQGKIFSNIIF